MEEWRNISGYEGLYQVSDQGRVRSMDRIVVGRHGLTFYKGRILKTGRSKYLNVSLSIGCKVLCVNVHALVAKTFIGPCPPGMEVCHENSQRHDCRAKNLRYDTRPNNHADKWRTGVYS